MLTNEEAFMTKHHIQCLYTINVMYSDINLYQLQVLHKHEVKPKDYFDCITLKNIKYNHQTYKIRVFKNHLIIINVKDDLSNLIRYTLNYCHIPTFTMIKTEYIYASTSFKVKTDTFSADCGDRKKIKYGSGHIHVYANHCVFSSTDVINMYSYIYGITVVISS